MTTSKKASTREIGSDDFHQSLDNFVPNNGLPLSIGTPASNRHYINPTLMNNKGHTLEAMSRYDSTVHAILFLITMTCRSARWSVYPSNENPTPEESAAVDFLETVLFDDMQGGWEDFISGIMTMLIHGWSFFEVVYKYRNGPLNKIPSHFDDGYLGLKKIAPRPQLSLKKWLTDSHGEPLAFQQEPSSLKSSKKNTPRNIPISKGLLFQTNPTVDLNNPHSPLDSLIPIYSDILKYEQIRSSAVERELVGFPVISIPGEVLEAASNPKHPNHENAAKLVRAYESIGKSTRFNDKDSVIIPSNTFKTDDSISTVRQYNLELLPSQGQPSINISSLIQQLRKQMASALLCDFLFVGDGATGSYALVKSRTALFTTSIDSWLKSISSNINKNLIPQLWAYNGFDPALMPSVLPDSLTKDDLKNLADFVSMLANASLLNKDDPLIKEHLARVAGLPTSTSSSSSTESQPDNTYSPSDDEPSDDEPSDTLLSNTNEAEKS